MVNMVAELNPEEGGKDGEMGKRSILPDQKEDG